MTEIKKAISTAEAVMSAVSLIKTASIVLVMMLLEWGKLKERRALAEAEKAKNDLEVEKKKAELSTNDLTPTEQIDAFLKDNLK